ncbi:unnamed protein product [Kluyveromyces dobzhanskii CBS 2104]|uniref:WGS project CCBQ000000000 data, contig 00107 n=1 Tax=Kluyveromyces dobzhanskii CBS 2104 TaxID=1427455 RepID=A0A0A8L1E4_9SACH|nr:unnamed protein product [Kluyveromyces dobzhanskii CBS 2104]
MSTTYSVHSVGSYMKAMDVMVSSVEQMSSRFTDSAVPEVDQELKTGYKNDDKGKLLVTSQDRNDWDDIFDEFSNLSSERLLSLVTTNYSNSNGQPQIFKELFRLLENVDSDFSQDQLLQQLVELLRSNEKTGTAEQDLFDYLGAENVELISFLIENQDLLKQTPTADMSNSSMHDGNGFMTEEDIKRQVMMNVENGKNIKLAPAQRKVRYPHVFRQSEDAGSSMLSFAGQKFALPSGSSRSTFQTHEEITIPCAEPKTRFNIPLIKVSDLDDYCRKVFEYEYLNKVQSLVYPVAYNTNGNMLICAPTGAGKTDIALLTILNTIKQYSVINEDGDFDIEYDDFKIIYVAPLKALAAEITDKFARKLSVFDVKVRELTGDMQLTKKEILDTQVIVTTPEKWDVVTRKASGDNDLTSKVKLLILDEVHLLHEDRGSVIESLVARTLRQVESSQTMIRILGLSATLPNFVDVADFLGVNRNVGMFYFDQSFRPKALEQHLIGCRGKAGSKQCRENTDKVAYEKASEMMKRGNQVMIFVHSRKDTVRTARTLINMARENHEIDSFKGDEVAMSSFQKDLSKHKDKDLKELSQSGFGVHHAGMSRSDRNITEKMFKSGAINLLVCTATLAWGVNLPADCVIIKGTQIYDSKKGGYNDLGISDVIQIFGRAGRPGFGADYGTAYLCTSGDRLDHYVDLISQQHPIESRLGAKIVDNLNAEISLGTVTNVEEGVKWLGYTYMFVRMKQNPFTYGIDWEEILNDPQLYDKRRQIIITAARRLHSLQMIVFDEVSMHFISKDLGRIASEFYLLNESVEIFNQIANPRATEADVLAMISMSSEFDSIKFREEESGELKKLLENAVECQISGDLDSSAGKTNILLQAYVTQSRINDSALNSDANYIAQNSARICRALLLIGINRRWGTFSMVMLDICKSIEKRMWAFDHPLCQFDLPDTILRNIKAKNPSMELLLDMDSSELADLVHNQKMGGKLYRIISRFPRVDIDAEIFPITTNVMRIHISLSPDFEWDYRVHGDAQFFWVFVEESNQSSILHFEKFILNKKQLSNPHEMDFMIPLSDPLPPQVVVKVVSDTWIGCESMHAISFQHLIRPHNETLQTRLQKLNPLPTNALKNPLLESIYNFKYFNPMQTMVFHTLYHSNVSTFVGSPTGSGKTVVAELAIWHAFRDFPGSKVVYIAPMKALVRERVDDWRKRITPATGDRIVELTGDSVPDPQDIKDATIVITTPEKFDGISRNWQTRKFVQNVSLIIMDEIHLLASDRGPILEMIVSRMNYVSSQTKKPVRLLGMSTAVSNAFDMASWLGVKENGLYNFPSSVRPVPLKMYIDGFPDNLNFCPLMKTMNKPAFMAIKQHSPEKPVLIFVASRRQTRLTALDLIHLCGMEDNPRRFLHIDDEEELQYYISKVSDDTLKLSLQFGIGLHHAGLIESDRAISHELFQRSKIQILVATSTLAWGVNLPAHLVIIKGTQFFDAKIEGYRDMDLTDILQMMGRAGRPAYDTSGTAIVYTKESKKMFYKHFLNVGFPVESSLHKVLDDHIGAEISSGTITTKQEALDFLNWTFLFRRAHHNPTYYGITEDTSTSGVNKYLSDLVNTTLDNLKESTCVEIFGTNIYSTPFLSISSYYYISHKTIRSLLKQITPHASFQEVLRWLSLAVEYDELPVRNGEIIMNVEMSAQSRYSIESSFAEELYLPMWDPHVKAFLLLQAYLSRAELPIVDYHQDTISVLDQSLRILQAYVDVAAEKGYFKTVMTLIKAMQCVKQGHWYEDDPISSLPGARLKRDDTLEFGEDGWPLSGKGYKMSLDTLGRLDSTNNRNKLKSILNKQYHVKPEQQKQMLKEVSKLPILDNIEFVPQTSNESLILKATHHNKTAKDFSIYCAKYPKTQRELWFAIAYRNDELLMLKRCQPRSGPNGMGVLKFDFIVPESIRGEELNFMLINDALDIKYDLKHTLIV